MMKRFSRRNFLKQSAAFTVMAATTVTGLTDVARAEERRGQGSIEFDDVFDIIVVGSGLSGTTAGIHAAEMGNKVVILDKMNVLGGTSLISGLNFACVGSDEQAAKGIKDTPEMMASDMRKVSGDWGDPQLGLEVAKTTSRFYRFAKDRGVKFESLKTLGGHSIPRALWAKGGGIGFMHPLHAYAQAKLTDKLQMRKRVKVDDILFGQGGRAIGVRVREGYQFNFDDPQSDDNTNTTGAVKYYGAKKGIIFASGGFCRDKSMLGSESRILAQAQSSANPGATAGTLKMLMSHGAQAVNLSLFRLAYPIPVEDIKWGMLVNPEGKRFVNEQSDRNTIGTIILRTKDKFGGKAPVLIYDQVGAENFHDKQRFALSLGGKNGLDGSIYKFNTLDEVAKKFGYDPAILKQAASDYNAMIDSGEDKEFGKDIKALKGAALKKGPFYAMRLHANCTFTPGGVRIDKAGRILNVNGEAMAGLFAAGEFAGGIHGAERLTACSCPTCGAFGLISADSAHAMHPVDIVEKARG